MAILQCAINGANNSGNAFFFRGDHYIVFDWNRTTTDKTGAVFKGRAVSGPFRVDSAWSLPLTMLLSGFASSLDAGLSGDAGGSPAFHNKMYFFKGAEYVRFDYLDAPVRIPDSAGNISAWNLPAGFGSDIRGALNGKRSRLGFAYFFKGPSYERYSWANNTVDADYPKPISSLINMPQPFWSGIDAALDGDGDFADFGYLFRDDSYCRFNWVDVRVDNGPHMVWDSWPGVLELLLAAEAKTVALSWVSDAHNQLKFYIASLNSGIPSPFNTALMEAALQTHFHVTPSMNSATRMALLVQIEQGMGQIEDALGKLGQIVQFHDDGEVKAHDASYVEADGSPNFRAYTGFNDHIYLTSRFVRMCDDQFNAAAVLIHEAVHYIDSQADTAHDSPEWYLTGQPRLKAKVMQGGVEVEVDVEYYDQLTPNAAVHNPSSYNAFSQHVTFGNDRRLGKEILRPGY